jgi:putative MATE family efflux protein
MTRVPDKLHADYTEGSIVGSILKMGLPSMFGFLSQNIYSLVDTYWVSRLPQQEAAVAAVTFFSQIMWLFFSFNQMVGPGSVAVISRRYGEKEYDKAEKAIKETLTLKLTFGLAFGVLGFFLVDEMLWVLGAREEALQQGIVYGQIMFVGMGIMYATYSIFTGMRCVANPKMAMFLMIGSNVLNMVLDPIMIFGYFGLPAMGIQGAAVASVTSFTLTFSMGLLLFYSDRTNVRLTLRGREPMDMVSMWKLLRIGIPAWLGEVSFSSSRLVITPLIAVFGTEVVAAYGVGNQIFHFGLMVLVGIGLGLSALIGHNVGSGKPERARQTADTAVLMGTVIMTLFGIASYVFAPQIVRAFFDNPETIRHGVVLLRVAAIGMPFVGAWIMMEEIHMGVGMNTPPMIVNVIHAWLLQVGPIVVLTEFMGLGVVSIWWALTLSSIFTALAFFFYYRRGYWLTKRV